MLRAIDLKLPQNRKHLLVDESLESIKMFIILINNFLKELIHEKS
jgi:hypothetical protein